MAGLKLNTAPLASCLESHPTCTMVQSHEMPVNFSMQVPRASGTPIGEAVVSFTSWGAHFSLPVKLQWLPPCCDSSQHYLMLQPSGQLWHGATTSSQSLHPVDSPSLMLSYYLALQRERNAALKLVFKAAAATTPCGMIVRSWRSTTVLWACGSPACACYPVRMRDDCVRRRG